MIVSVTYYCVVEHFIGSGVMLLDPTVYPNLLYCLLWFWPKSVKRVEIFEEYRKSD